MRLFFANTTQQATDFIYRVPESNRTITQTIPSGQQRVIADDKLNTPQINSIIAQHEKYGRVRYEEWESTKNDQITGIFRVDESIPARVIDQAILYNRKELTKEGKRRREELAVVTSNLIAEKNEAAGQSLQISIEEEQPGTINAAAGEVLREGYAGPESTVAKLQGSQSTNKSIKPPRRR